MVFAEFFLIAFAVGTATQSWLGLLGTFFGLAAVYRLTPLAALLALALSLYWGLLGYWLGAATGEPGVGPLLAVVGFLAGAKIHRSGFAAATKFLHRIRHSASLAFGRSAGSREAPALARRWAAQANADVIDVEYRIHLVISKAIRMRI